MLIEALVFVEDDDDAVLEAAIRKQRAERGYFPVTRVGVSNSSVDVRFGRCLWKRETAGRSHLLRLVADADVVQESSPWFRLHQPELLVAQQKAVALEDQLTALMDALSESSVLSQEQAAEIRARADDSWPRHIRDFDEVRNIESYFD